MGLSFKAPPNFLAADTTEFRLTNNFHKEKSKMAQKLQYQNHASNPAAQAFNVGPRPNKTKKNSWWNIHSSNYWRNAGKKKKSEE